MTVRADEVVSRLRVAFERAADPERAAGAAAYMRDQFPFFGIPTPERRRIARSVLRELPAPDERELAVVTRALWVEPEREFQHTGCDYLRSHIRVASAPFIDVVEETITTKPWWDTVDIIAAHTAGPLVRTYPALVAVMDQWIGSDRMWLARTALLHQLAYKEATDATRLFRYCEQRADDREFFIRKAIGWALRTYAAIDPDAVDLFVASTAELSALSVREAVRGVIRARTRAAQQV